MKEFCEFRIVEDFASKLFGGSEGKRLGDTIRKVELATDDPRFHRVGELQREISAATERSFFHGWILRRKYTDIELEAAQLFNLRITAMFEPAGEQCGTTYDYSAVCVRCGVGRKQTSDLHLDLRKVPKTKDIARTIADEWIVSQRLAQLMVDAGLTGFELHPVRHKARYDDDPIDLNKVPTGQELLRKASEAGAPRGTWEYYVWINRPEQKKAWDQAKGEYAKVMTVKESRRKRDWPVWYQLIATSRRVPLSQKTRFGIDPFDDDAKSEFRCPLGHVVGLNILSEIHVNREGWDGSDVCCSQEMVGTRRGQLVPAPLLLASPKLWRLMQDKDVKGCSFEIAHFVK